MRLKNIHIIILVLLIGIGFTSCEEYYWETGTMDSEGVALTNRNGQTLGIFSVNEGDINLKSRRGHITDFRFVGGFIGLETNVDKATNIWLRIEGTNIEIPFARADKYREYNDKLVQDFLYEVVETVHRRRGANIIIEGNSRYSDLILYVDLKIDLDVRIRD